MDVFAPWIFAGFCFLVSGLLFLQIESTVQAIIATALAFIGAVTIWWSNFYKPDPLRKKKFDLNDDVEYFTMSASRAKKKLKEIAEQEELSSRYGAPPTLSEDGKSIEKVDKIDGEYVVVSEPLARIHQKIYVKEERN